MQKDQIMEEKDVLNLLMSRKDIRKLVEKSNECYSKMDFVGAMKYRKEIKDIVDRESKIMLTKSESLVSLMNNADNEYKFNMLVWLHSMMCMADVFNGILEDFKDGVRKANGNSKFVKFDNLDRLMTECKKEIDYPMKGTSKSFQISFAVRSDEMREMIENMVGDNIREGYDMFKEEAKMTKETDRSKIEEFNKKNLTMIKCNIKLGDIVHTQIGIGEVIAISKTKETLMVKMDDGRECAIRLEYVKDVFDNYRDDI